MRYIRLELIVYELNSYEKDEMCKIDTFLYTKKIVMVTLPL